jgi:L-aspartate oxidase
VTVPHRYLTSFDTHRLPNVVAEVCVIGSGVAGLRAAIAAAEHSDVLLVSKGPLGGGNTPWAQGGIVCADGAGDSAAEHASDTLAAGKGIGEPDAARVVSEEGPARVRELMTWGANFDRGPDGELHRTREGGHGRARILHADGDATGAEIARTLVDRVAELIAEQRIRPLSGGWLIDLLTDPERRRVTGALVQIEGQGRCAIWAEAVVLATGGAAALYRETTNPAGGGTGDGIAAAWRAGADTRDMEFVQFHPTTLYVAGAPRTLVTEAIRGEGAWLVDRNGDRFMPAVHPQAELAPRDVVSRTIAARMQELGDPSVFIDCSHLDAAFVRARFPNVAAACTTVGLDLATDRIPVRPASHYFMGGVAVDLDGATSVDGLWACGEVTCSGLHGANRLGSNSLLEGLVFGARAGAAAAAAAQGRAVGFGRVAHRTGGTSGQGVDVQDVRNALAAVLDRRVGIVRDADGLARAAEQVEFWDSYVGPAELENTAGWNLQNRLRLALQITAAAAERTESRGVHYRSDYPERDDARFARHVVHAGLQV